MFDGKIEMIQLSDFLKYLSDSGIDITDQCIGKHEMSIEDIAKEYINQIDPVTAGQTVWVIKEEYPKIKLIECIVDHIRVSNYKRSFTVRSCVRGGNRHYYNYNGTFVKSSIGKKVFLTKDDAIKFLDGKEYEEE